MNYLVTVIVMTYNQVNYIEKALDSIFSQKTNFDFLVLVHDDCSSDGTYEKLLEYKEKYNNKINIIEEENRRFLEEGFNMMIFNHVAPFIKTKYVAYCDGDDYWLDSNKLQKQFDFMEKNPNYAMCYHSAYQLESNGTMNSKWFIHQECDNDLSDFVNEKPGIIVPTSSIFLKKEIFCDFPRWRKDYPVEDLPLYMLCAIKGKIHCFSDIMCVYRKFADGSWSKQNKESIKRRIEHNKRLIEAVIQFNEATFFTYQNLVKKQIDGCQFRIALLENNYKVVFGNKFKYLLKQLSFKTQIVLKIKFRFPKLYSMITKGK